MRDSEPRSSGISYTTVNLNTTGKTTVYDPDNDAFLYGAYMPNGGSTAVAQLEITDGSTNGSVTTAQTAGDGIAFGDTLELSGAVSVAVNVTTAEGSALNETATVSHSET